jgi:hypothetical protein
MRSTRYSTIPKRLRLHSEEAIETLIESATLERRHGVRGRLGAVSQ